MNLERLKEELRRDEGLRLKAYYCTTGHRTIGYGHLVEDHIEECSLEEAEAWLVEDILEARRVAEEYIAPKDFFHLPDHRQRALVNLAYNMGGNLKKFGRMKMAILDGDWVRAARELERSKYARQVGQRAARLAQMMRKESE